MAGTRQLSGLGRSTYAQSSALRLTRGAGFRAERRDNRGLSIRRAARPSRLLEDTSTDST